MIIDKKIARNYKNNFNHICKIYYKPHHNLPWKRPQKLKILQMNVFFYNSSLLPADFYQTKKSKYLGMQLQNLLSFFEILYKPRPKLRKILKKTIRTIKNS